MTGFQQGNVVNMSKVYELWTNRVIRHKAIRRTGAGSAAVGNRPRGGASHCRPSEDLKPYPPGGGSGKAGGHRGERGDIYDTSIPPLFLHPALKAKFVGACISIFFWYVTDRLIL